MEDWINKISFHAQLPPSLQLLSYDDNHKNSPGGNDRLPPLSGGDISSSSSRGSTPELSRRRSLNAGGGANHPHSATAASYRHDKPPVPPRGAPPPVPVRTPSNETIPVQMRPRQG
ncbi:hypothetical protein LSTR_LSTR016840 [Laodelphax striatellus]|nr:hypothetical protein LSTR_LSTR016840 [Laodelphax striatellus]